MNVSRRGAIGTLAAAGLTACSKSEPKAKAPAAMAASEGRADVPGGTIWWK